jgi:azurin
MKTKTLPVLLALALLGASSSALAAGNCTIAIKSDDAMKFDLKEATVSASCAAITIELTHTGKLPVTAMGHNVVIAKTPDVAGISKDALKAGAAGGYLPKGDARVIAHTELVGGGGKTKVSFPGKKLTAGGDYTFFCSFPGHGTLMKGKLTVTK